LYITPEERRVADRWLESRGLRQGERLFVFLDSSSRRDKLLRVHVYFGLLQYVLGLEDTKVLIYDEKDVGKEGFYREWVGEAGMEKLIFSKSLGLRKDITLIGSHYTRLVFGPCTGLMHCAVGAYNRFVREGMSVRDVPLMMVYTGLYPPAERNAAFWWDRSPLMNCLLIQDGGHEKELVTLDSLPDHEKAGHVPYPCSDYTADMLIGFFGQKLITRKIYA
jgi:hypothetical protein